MSAWILLLPGAMFIAIGIYVLIEDYKYEKQLKRKDKP